MTSLYDILDQITQLSTSNSEKGDRFERLTKSFLETDPIYVNQFSRVWRWIDWPGRAGKPDTGIDLVAQHRDSGDYCAIQCKFYSPTYTLQKHDIDSFFTASGKEPFTDRLIFSTTDKWSVHAEDALDAQTKPIARVRVQDLVDSAVDWDQFDLDRPGELTIKAKKSLRPHQQLALDHVVAGFVEHDRGKLIMACGTGKTFTSLKIAERLTPKKGWILFLVPSISLLQQTLKEWSVESHRMIRAYAVCSDASVGRNRKRVIEDISAHDLAIPASTNASRLVEHGMSSTSEDLTVIFSTYQSLQVIHDAQCLGLPQFDLVVCDEAHRTTGVTLAGEDESAFVRVHQNEFIKAQKRLYMTATPRIYADETKSKAAEADAVLCSMDDPALFGEEFHRLGFGEAVGADLLSDYKVLVLAVDEKYVASSFQSQLARDNQLTLQDAVKIVGCWNGLAKRHGGTVDGDGFGSDPQPMRRAVAFSRSIKDSEKFRDLFGLIVDEIKAGTTLPNAMLDCEVEHVDGTFNVLRRNELLDWLKEPLPSRSNMCRILSNARCLSEGVDVPALDAVLFLNPRDSVVDVVQSVGRVMRKATGKKYGYIILPIGVPTDIPAEEALSNNKQYKVVWQVLQALRAHDDRFNALINKIELNDSKDDQLQVIGVGGGPEGDGDKAGDPSRAVQVTLGFPGLNEWRDAIYAKIVKKCGDRRYWETWAQDIAKIADAHIARIQGILARPTTEHAAAFNKFMDGLHENINPSVTRGEAIEMLAQHLITRPVFDALFEGYAFAEHNPVSQAMQQMLDVLDEQSLGKERAKLDKFYASVRQRAAGIDNASGKQTIVRELYEEFFKSAFPNMAQRLGIVYTPGEVVDFIIQSVEVALREQFGASVADPGVHVIDPFTGTGTFIVRLLQSGLIRPEKLLAKYLSELHANEIVLLAYYVAAINIEAAFHDLAGGVYEPFEGIVLTDTFQLSESRSSLSADFFPENNERAVRQQSADIKVIVGNPPYSVGQTSANDNNQNLSYARLDGRIRQTYAANSAAGLKRNLYDAYIRAIRWATDRIGDKGVICFVTNGSFIDTASADGLRKSLTDEFSVVYCFNLRGAARGSGEERRREKGNVFEDGTRTPVAITLLIKNPDKQGKCHLYYHDIGDYLSREEKLAIVSNFGSIAKVPWQRIIPNRNHDWINQRDPGFESFLPLGAARVARETPIFSVHANGIVTNRDVWVYNFSRSDLGANISRMISNYNEQVTAFAALKQRPPVEQFINTDSARIKWSRGLKNSLASRTLGVYRPERRIKGVYRPFNKQWLYLESLTTEVGASASLAFPSGMESPAIYVTGASAGKPFSVLMIDAVPNLHFLDSGHYFPRYRYEGAAANTPMQLPGVDGASSFDSFRHDAITDAALSLFQDTYCDPGISKDDIFFYVYGVLHSAEYRSRFEANLSKMMPRIPFAADFHAFSTAGRELAKWHLKYESVEPWPVQETTTAFAWPEKAANLSMPVDPDAFYRVSKMKFGKNGKEIDKSVIIYNSRVTLSGIPLGAHEYQVNGKSAIEWIMDRYQVTTDKDSGILNDPNKWSDDPRYIIDLLKRIVRVSVETNKIIGALPPLNESGPSS